jgi:hypothetical protein
MPAHEQPKILEGTWEEIASHAAEFNGHRLRVTILPDGPQPGSNKITAKGMFPNLADITEEDFKIAEFHGDPDDGLDWNA